MKRGIYYLSIIAALSLMTLISPLNLNPAAADEQELFTEGSSVKPNVLMILDNSQSMDEDFVGNSVCPWATNSRLVEGKRALRDIVTNYATKMRLGLMSYSLGSVSNYRLHNAVYFASYEPKSYCPDPPAACTDYCKTDNAASGTTCQASCFLQNIWFDKTYRDEIITTGTGYAVGTEQRDRYCDLIYPKKNRYTNPTDTSRYVYYRIPGTYYSSSDQGNRFCYAASYNPDETVNDNYRIYPTKTGTSDGSYASPNPGSYSGSYSSSTFSPTDEDIALGFKDFGRRMSWYYVGRTWYRNSSPGVGYLHKACDTNLSNNSQRDALLAKLEMKEGDETGYMGCSSGNTCAYIVNAGLTPTAGTFQSSIDYFKGSGSYTSPISDSCQKNFVVYVTDGLPSVGTNGATGTADALMPDALGKIDALRATVKRIGSTDYTFNIKTYILGMALTDASKTHLNNMASHGGTAQADGTAYYADNTTALSNALNNIFSDIDTRSYTFSTASVSSSRLADEDYLYEASFAPTSTDPFWKGYLKKWSLKTDGSLDAVLWEAGSVLRNASAAGRTIYTLIGGTLTSFNTGLSYTYFNVANQTAADSIINYIRGVGGSNPEDWKLGDIYHSNPITIGSPSPFFSDFRDSATNNAFKTFRDAHPRASNCSDGGTSCSGYGKRLIIAGANDGQFHAFKGTDGSEYWSFIPPNLLPKLQYLAHTSHPLADPVPAHMFYVDGPVTAADVWLGTGDGTAKTNADGTNDWKTLAIFSLGRNDRDYTTADKSAVPQSTKYWSTNSSCDGNLKEAYDSTDTTHTYYYCGYYAFDFTDVTTTLPSLKWKLNINTTKYSTQTAATVWPYLGEPWGKMTIGRVIVNGNEKWVGFISGGYNAADCSGGGSCDTRGKGVFAVDLSDGSIMWSYTHANHADMDYSIAAPLAIVDTDNDGFIDAAYVGDLKGNAWQFHFCKSNSSSTCNTSNWTGSLLLDKLGGSDKFPLYNQMTVSKDSLGNLWLYWATGDKVDPTGSGPAAYVYGLKPLLCVNSSGTPTPCVRNDLDNITSQQQAYCGATSRKVGWYINLAGNSEQVLAEPVAFGNVLYFTSFVPASGSSASCTKTGTSYLYAINIDNNSASCGVGTGVFSGAERRMEIGVGISSAPMISLKPGSAPSPDIYVTTSGAGGQESSTLRVNFDPPTVSNRTNMLYWKDRRLQ